MAWKRMLAFGSVFWLATLIVIMPTSTTAMKVLRLIRCECLWRILLLNKLPGRPMLVAKLLLRDIVRFKRRFLLHV